MHIAASAWGVFDLPYAVDNLPAHTTVLSILEQPQNWLICEFHNRKVTSRARTSGLSVDGVVEGSDVGGPSLLADHTAQEARTSG
jgi:hypothetical protein